MKKIIWPGILAAIVTFIVGMGLTFLYNAVFPAIKAEYENTGLFRSAQDPLMMVFFAYPLVLGIALSWLWDKTKSSFKGTTAQRGINFGIAYFIIATIPGMFITYTSFQVSLLMVLIWTLSGLINGMIAGSIFARMNP